MDLTGYIYNCAGGETWDGIALELFGDEKYAADLLCANPEQCHKSIFVGGEKLYLPVIDTSEEDEGDTSDLPTTPPWKE